MESIAPPGWTPAPKSSSSPTPTEAATAQSPAMDRRTDGAVRWRIGAAIIDNLLIYLGYLALCLLLHWRVAALDHMLVLVSLGVAYHFVLESRDGQTIGKRRYGIRVVAADGGTPTARAIAVRSVLRIVDQLPVAYVSGLVSMVRTGPARRQRIGDVAAGTLVVAVEGQAARRGTPGWMLPAATIVATLLSVLTLVGIVEAGRRPLDRAQRAQFISGCQQGPAGQLVSCACVLNQLEANGYNTPNALRDFVTQERAELAAGRMGPAREAVLQAAGVCRR